ncbi:PAS domain S-box-containing protein/diguanylate cyclase (GGDEF)-like protein [Pseudomonas duriflava]|uniref:cyclic-guanylate-specific phosphodiesterase n=1 Tax=Pseudomonas duriflava TaxID=459528 RepID=A0A562QC50_9PSED|nr:EAL domain-containing protein [Pseudomonas duriflava]TWI54304.1 PAS domain S-box-containing protein/diguanylate cyclase (GGDEF)-like protein [Pseudomonas duriflava]
MYSPAPSVSTPPLQGEPSTPPTRRLLRGVLVMLLIVLFGLLFWQLHRQTDQQDAFLRKQSRLFVSAIAERLNQELEFKADAALSLLDAATPTLGNPDSSVTDRLRKIYPGLRAAHWLPAGTPAETLAVRDKPLVQRLVSRIQDHPFYYSYSNGDKGTYYALLAAQHRGLSGWWIIEGQLTTKSALIDRKHFQETTWIISDQLTGKPLFSSGQDLNVIKQSLPEAEPISSITLRHTDWVLLGYRLQQENSGVWKIIHSGEWLGLLVLAIAFLTLLFFLQREQRGLHAATASSRRNLRLASQALNVVEERILVTYPDGHLLYLNQQASRLFGIDPAHANQHKLAQLLPDVDLDTIQNARSKETLLALEQEGLVRQFSLDCYGLDEHAVISSTLRDQHPLHGSHVWVLRDVTEQQKILDTVEHTRQRYQNIFEGVSTGLCIFDLSELHRYLAERNLLDVESLHAWLDTNPHDSMTLLGFIRVTEINQVALALLGLENLEDVQASLIGQAMPHPQGKRMKMIAALISGQRALDIETRLQTPQGERFLWLSMHLPSAEVGYEAVPLSINDISSRRRMELSLIEREKFWSDLVSAAPDTLYTYDLETRALVYKNHPLGLKLGYDSTELDALGDDYRLKLLHPDDSELYGRLQSMRQIIGPGQVTDCLVRWRHRNGSWRWFDLREQSFQRNSRGQVTKIIGLALDVTDMVTANDLLRDKERRYRLLAEGLGDVIYTTDAQLNMDYISASAEDLLGYSLETLHQINPLEFITNTQPLHKVRLLTKRLRQAKDSPRLMAELRQEPGLVTVVDCLHANGHKLHVELRLEMLWDEHGRFEGLLGICRNVSAQRKADKDMRMAATVFDHSAAAILVTDPAGYIVRINKTFTRMTGFEPHDIMDQLPDKLCADQQEVDLLHDVMTQLANTDSWEGELWQKRKDGEPYPSWVGITAVRDDEGDLVSFVWFFVDISERKASERRIHRLAYYDALTLLPNRTLFQDRLHLALQQAAKHSSWVVLMFLDLDRFKPINDSLGHAAGDRMLKEVAMRLTSCVGTEDSVARMGGDEFTLLLANLESRETALACAIRVAEQILESLSEAFILEGREFFVSASIGIALSPQDGSELSQLMKNADTAMYHAKDMGKNNFQFYQTEMNARALERLELESDLRHALLQNEFKLYYQPQYRSENGRLTGVEALLRWQHPRRGDVPPADFIPVLEETGLIMHVGDWVIREACRQLKDWHNDRVRIPKVSVNLSARQFTDGQLGERIAQILADVNLPPACLELELTESILMQDVSEALSILGRLKQLGVCIAVDDFGTGYSSLNYLKQLPIDILKIDRSFVDGLPYGEQDGQIARAIIAMAHSLNLSVIAEGVETEAQLQFLRDHGCDEVQGYFFAKPMTPDRIKTHVNNAFF